MYIATRRARLEAHEVGFLVLYKLYSELFYETYLGLIWAAGQFEFLVFFITILSWIYSLD